MPVRRSLRPAVALVMALLATAGPAGAETVRKMGRFGGMDVHYAVLTPPGYDPTKAYPAVLVFTGGGQSLPGAEATIAADWKAEADRRSYIIISPAAPNPAALYFDGGDRAFPDFLEMIRRDYRIAGKLHVAGHSNGGLSAFHIAALNPGYFATVTAYPGLLNDPEPALMAALKPMCLFMHAGSQDPDWAGPMKQQAEEMQRAGYRIAYRVERGQAHRLRSSQIGLSQRLFDQIEGCG